MIGCAFTSLCPGFVNCYWTLVVSLSPGTHLYCSPSLLLSVTCFLTSDLDTPAQYPVAKTHLQSKSGRLLMRSRTALLSRWIEVFCFTQSGNLMSQQCDEVDYLLCALSSLASISIVSCFPSEFSDGTFHRDKLTWILCFLVRLSTWDTVSLCSVGLFAFWSHGHFCGLLQTWVSRKVYTTWSLGLTTRGNGYWRPWLLNWEWNSTV